MGQVASIATTSITMKNIMYIVLIMGMVLVLVRGVQVVEQLQHQHGYLRKVTQDGT